MMSSPGNLFVRANYLASTICGSLLAALPALFFLPSMFAKPMSEWPGIVVTPLLTFGLLAFPGLRAIRRLFANGTVIPPELVSERPIVSFVVTLFGGFAHLFFILTMAMAIGIALAPEWPEEAKKILGPWLAGMAFYFIALWCGEIALVGNGESDNARAAKSGTVF
jgi:hypothetical protein